MEKPQQELHFLGFFGIFKESFRIIFSKPKLFTQITFTFILPLSIISNLYKYFSYTFSSKRLINSTLLEFCYYLVILIPSILSTSTVVCAVTFLYTAKDVTFKKITGTLPKNWKRVMITFALSFAIDFCYKYLYERTTIFFMMVYLYLAASVHIIIVRNFATVVSVLEDLSGFKAMIKSNNLIKGKIGVAVFMFFVFWYCFLEIDKIIYKSFRHLNWRNEVGIGIPFLILLESMVTLLGLVVGTIIYFSCKSYEVTMRVLASQSHKPISSDQLQINGCSLLDPLIE